MTHVYSFIRSSMPVTASLVLVSAISLLAASHFSPAPTATPPPAAVSAAAWLGEHAQDVRDARALIAEHEKNKAVLATFNCSFDWDTLSLLDCAPSTNERVDF